MVRDVAGYNGFGIMQPDDIEGCYLAANAEQHFTVPNNYPNWIAVFSYTPGANIFVSTSTTAAVPSSTMGAIHSELNPSARFVTSGQTVSMITPDSDSPYVTVSLLIVPPFGN
jgi:hypothetical protein